MKKLCAIQVLVLTKINDCHTPVNWNIKMINTSTHCVPIHWKGKMSKLTPYDIVFRININWVLSSRIVQWDMDTGAGSGYGVDWNGEEVYLDDFLPPKEVGIIF